MNAAVRPWPGDLAWGGNWVSEAGQELVHLGFVLRDGLQPGSVPGPRLLVALRDVPTLEHFDPEEATFWVADHGRGRVATFPGAVEVPGSIAYSWGRIRVNDRIPVSNQFLGFGGTLLVERADASTTLLAFVSRAPIVRCAGHSQGVDPFADEIGSFFARLKVPVDFQPEAEERIAGTSPQGLYAAFLQHAEGRLHGARRLAEADPGLARMVAHEVRRLQYDAPAEWREGDDLLGSLEIG